MLSSNTARRISVECISKRHVSPTIRPEINHSGVLLCQNVIDQCLYVAIGSGKAGLAIIISADYFITAIFVIAICRYLLTNIQMSQVAFWINIGSISLRRCQRRIGADPVLIRAFLSRLQYFWCIYFTRIRSDSAVFLTKDFPILYTQN